MRYSCRVYRQYLVVRLQVVGQQRVVPVRAEHQRVAAGDELRRLGGQLRQLVLQDLRRESIDNC